VPGIRLIVATAFAHDLVGSCLTSLLRETDYGGLRMSIVVDEASLSDPVAREVLAGLADDPRVTPLVYPTRPFNYSWVQNYAMARVDDELVCLVNDDVSVITPRWLEQMAGHVLQPRVGVVGARLLYPDSTVQHGGVLLGAAGLAGHYYHGASTDDPGYHGRAVLDQDLSCVTAACMLLRRDLYLDVGGMDEQLVIAYNDVDLCVRIARAGWRIVLAAGAELVHRESTSVGPPDAPERHERFAAERRLMKARWGEVLMQDPQYNPNLDLRRPGTLAFPPRVKLPWR